MPRSAVGNSGWSEGLRVIPCGEKRGGPRSVVTCQKPKTHPHTEHAGRDNAGRWYLWGEHQIGEPEWHVVQHDHQRAP